MHWTCARNTWCEHAPLPLPRLTECHSHLQTTSEPPTHAAPLHPLLSPTSPLPLGCRGALGGGRTLSSWSSVGHVGGSQRPHLSSRRVWCLPSKYSWLALSCHGLSIYPSVYDGIGRNVCHEESFLQFAILPTSPRHVDSHTAHCVQ